MTHLHLIHPLMSTEMVRGRFPCIFCNRGLAQRGVCSAHLDINTECLLCKYLTTPWLLAVTLKFPPSAERSSTSDCNAPEKVWWHDFPAYFCNRGLVQRVVCSAHLNMSTACLLCRYLTKLWLSPFTLSFPPRAGRSQTWEEDAEGGRKVILDFKYWPVKPAGQAANFPASATKYECFSALGQNWHRPAWTAADEYWTAK